jgi:hypothetical protein
VPVVFSIIHGRKAQRTSSDRGTMPSPVTGGVHA